jgi:enamine deaminase RidA (YjgF/YER057c/UK114 family)
MKLSSHNATSAPAPPGAYSQAISIEDSRRLVFVSGQIPVDGAGQTPAGFDEQCRLVWRNLEGQLQACGMTLDNLVKVTTYLSDRSFAVANRAVRTEVLGERRPALTVVITGIFDDAWLLEIEAVAAE